MRHTSIAAVTVVLAAFALAGGPASAFAAPKLDKASPVLMNKCLNGKHFGERPLTA